VNAAGPQRSRPLTALVLAALVLAGTVGAPVDGAQARPHHRRDSNASHGNRRSSHHPHSSDLHGRRHQVTHRIHRAKGDLDEVSRQLLHAAAALERSRTKLSAARSALGTARAEVAAAELVDEQLQARLADAEQRLAVAREALGTAVRQAAAQHQAVAALAVDQFQGGNPQLMSLNAVLQAGSPQAWGNQVAAIGDALDQNAASLRRLQATTVLRSVQQQRVRHAVLQVAQRRAAAASNLLLTQQAKARAATAEQAVAAQVRARAAARVAAHGAVVQERARLAQLRSERTRITTMLAAIARRQARQAQRRSAATVRPSTGYLSFPVNGPITSPYGMRVNPILHILELHDGTDFGAACGTPIKAAAPGKVLAAYYNIGYGNRLIVGDGFVKGVSLATSYNHLSRYAVAVGQHVQRGQVVGYVGDTGFSTGCHLHFMVYVNGQTVDPMTWL
jgi:murein DD-endopeptidase MepM/ murein hydrolase activator NlpD